MPTSFSFARRRTEDEVYEGEYILAKGDIEMQRRQSNL